MSTVEKRELYRKREFVAKLSELFSEYMATIEHPDGCIAPLLLIGGCDITICGLEDGLDSYDLEKLIRLYDDRLGQIELDAAEAQ